MIKGRDNFVAVITRQQADGKDLIPDERKKLNRLFDCSPESKLAYTFCEELTAIFEMQLTREEAKR